MKLLFFAYRLAFSSTCIAYLSTGLSVIVLNLVPVLTILFGYFPIALNFLTVIAITAYYGALNALSYACLSWGHYKVRFFIGVLMLLYLMLLFFILYGGRVRVGKTGENQASFRLLPLVDRVWMQIGGGLALRRCASSVLGTSMARSAGCAT